MQCDNLRGADRNPVRVSNGPPSRKGIAVERLIAFERHIHDTPIVKLLVRREQLVTSWKRQAANRGALSRGLRAY